MTQKLLILFVLIPFFGIAQKYTSEEQLRLDSLNAIIENPHSHDSLVAYAYLSLSEILYVSNLDTIIPLCEKAISIAENALKKPPIPKGKKRLSLLKPLAGALNNIGYVYLMKGDVRTAIDYYDQVKEISEETQDKEGLLTYYISVGFIYMKQGNIETALNYFHESLKYSEELGDQQNMAHALTNIGYMYEHQDEFEKGLEYYNKALKIYEKIENRQGMADCYNNIGVVYNNQAEKLSKKEKFIALAEKRREKGLDYHNKSLKIREEIGDKEGIAASLNIIGVIYSKQANVILNLGGDESEAKSLRKKALDYFKRSLLIREELGDKDGTTYSLNSITKIMIEQGNVSHASDYAKRSLILSKELGFPVNIKNAAELMSIIFEKQNRGMEALEMHKLYFNMHDSILNEETQKTVVKQEAKYEYQKKKVIDDAERDKLIAIEKEKKEKQEIITYSTAFGLVLVIGFTFCF